MQEIYLDNSATTKPCDAAITACVQAMQQDYGNPSSLHRKGFEAEKVVIKAKQELAKALFCEPSEILFTSGATESNNLAVVGSVLANKRKGNKIVTTAIEHPSVKETMKMLQQQGYIIKEVFPREDGAFYEMDFFDEVDDQTVLVSCMWVNNETGLILPIEKIAKAVKRKNPNTVVHVDAVQGFLKLSIKLKNNEIDLLSMSGHKVYAPKGIGALYIKKGIRLVPQTFGGNQQSGIRSGTEPTPLIAAFGAAVASQREQISAVKERYQQLKDYFVEKLAEIPEVHINTKLDNSAPHILNISIANIRSEVMLHYLEQYGIYVSSGSACAKGKQSYVLAAFGLEKEYTDTAIRISFSPDITIQQLDYVTEQLKEGINTLAKIKR
ncbi:cysteine desulfurase family protein [Paludicola sp. MB14-C6]|uniref:cysteine desulfurase family protein n=1 Tax=Paludihabitans sp. MB14-C6 TaxID=3070656 RepID=UPI0027DE2C38|nr:cysteine desulfurase family protein [Paludicola sp. MB14-C6]WMJ22123.1 cysteine desulfurase family protein [Paludicola sp. MB14-C6]